MMNQEVNISSTRSVESHMIHDGMVLHVRTSSRCYAVDHGKKIPTRTSSLSRVMDTEKAIPPKVAVQTPLPSGDRSMEDHTRNSVDFNGPKDPANPLNWSSAYKWSILALISVMSLVV